MDDALGRVVSEQIGLIPSFNSAFSGSPFSDGSQMKSAQSGYLRELHPELDFDERGEVARCAVGGGCALSADSATTKAIVETLERYATAAFAANEVVTARAEALGQDGLFWTRLPTPHVRSHHGGPWRKPRMDPGAPIRWIPGYHLLEDREFPVPMAMAHIFFRPMEGEKFHPPSTSGVAAHFSMEAAFLAGLYELVEREAVEAVWALRAPLREIVLDGPLSPELQAFVRADSPEFVDQRYYDATTDLGIPIVYAVRHLARPIGHDVIVSCASHHDAGEALLKARLEASGQQLTRQHESGGAIYTRYPAHSGRLVSDWQPEPPDLSFLASADLPPKPLSTFGDAGPGDARGRASDLLGRLAPDHPNIIAVNLTTDDLKAIGIHVVRVIVPTLIQLSPSEHRIFLEHPRLTRLARHFGLLPPSPGGINLAAQPFR